MISPIYLKFFMCFLSPIPWENCGAIYHRKATPEISNCALGAIMLKLGKFERLIADDL